MTTDCPSPRRRWTRRLREALVLWLVAVVTATALAGSGSATTTETIGAFPVPGTLAASARTQISFRGAPVNDLGAVAVSGSRTGGYAGHLVEHADGHNLRIRGDERD